MTLILLRKYIIVYDNIDKNRIEFIIIIMRYFISIWNYGRYKIYQRLLIFFMGWYFVR
jgi:hypothetical protein